MPYAPSGMSLERYHSPASYRGRSYDLSHLDPFVFEAASAKVPRPLRIDVRFTNHCYSEASGAGCSLPNATSFRSIRRL